MHKANFEGDTGMTTSERVPDRCERSLSSMLSMTSDLCVMRLRDNVSFGSYKTNHLTTDSVSINLHDKPLAVALVLTTITLYPPITLLLCAHTSRETRSGTIRFHRILGAPLNTPHLPALSTCELYSTTCLLSYKQKP